MVGIVLVSHGSFAEAMLESGEMVLGHQRNVAVAMLKPGMGPSDFKVALDAAVDSLASSDEVLFLVDLWGGTPFNTVSPLVEEREGWVAVTGLNLPMLIVAYTKRLTASTAVEIALEVASEGRKGVRVKPQELEA